MTALESVEVQYVEVPLSQVEPHPDLADRLDNDNEGLLESIRTNGQRDPGKIVKRSNGNGYWVFDGRRRLACCKQLFSLYGRPRLYKALLHLKISEEEVFVTAIVSNDSEKGERKNLSLLEEIALFNALVGRFNPNKAKLIGLKAGRNDRVLARMMELGEQMPEKLHGLHAIQQKAEFRFPLTYLEELVPYKSDAATFYGLAAVAAARRVAPSQLDATQIQELVKYYVPWFADLFPEHSETQVVKSGPSTDAENAGPSQQKLLDAVSNLEEVASLKTEEEVKTQPAEQKATPRIFEEEIYFAGCPHCGASNPFQLKGKLTPELTFINFSKVDGNPQKDSVSPVVLYKTDHDCMKCGNQFNLVASPKGPRLLGIATNRMDTIVEPESMAAGGLLAWDSSLAKPGKEYLGWVYVGADGKKRFVDGRLVPLKEN